MEEPRATPTIRRWLLPICLAWIGVVAGLVAGVVSAEGTGLAGLATVLLAGLVGLTLGAVTGGVAAWRLSAGAVRRAFPVVAALALAAAGLVAAQVQRSRTGREIRISAESAARTAPFTAGAISHRRDDGSSFLEIAVNGADDTFVMTPRDRAGHTRCQGVVTSARHEALLDAVRAAEAVLARDRSPCTPVVGEPLRTYRWSLPERGGQTREVGLTAACAGAFPELDGLYAALDALAFSAASTAGALTCDPPTTGVVE